LAEKAVEYLKSFSYPLILALMLFLSAFRAVNEFLGFPLALVPLVISGGNIFWSTLKATLETKRITAGVLVVIAMAATAYIEDYLAAAVVGWMMIVGESIEALTLDKTRNAVRELIKLTPRQATVKRGDDWVTVGLDEVNPGDTVLVRPGERVPVDGVVLSGAAALNESSITGESMPVEKTAGDKVFAGTISESGALEVRVEKLGEDTTLGQIVKVVKEAQDNRGQAQRVADRFAAYFTPVTLILAAIVYWWTGELVRGVTLLVIACPCALVLATPTSVVASVGNAARRGALIKGGVTLEAAGRVNAVLFDKTGTLTHGIPRVVAVQAFGGRSEDEVLALAAAAETRSEHPIARAIMQEARRRQLAVETSQEFTAEIGRGVRARVGQSLVEVGNRRLLDGASAPGDIEAFLEEREEKGETVLLVKANGQVIGGLSVADTVRASAGRAVRALKELGVETVIMLTGDNPATARSIAQAVGIEDYRAELLPEDKLDIVRQLQRQGKTVAMVGDGVNDGPALALADVGIAMGAAGTDVAIETSDIALMGDNLLMVPEILGLSRRALKIIGQNIWAFAVGVNLVGMFLAGSGHINPIMAALIHNAASVAVVGNSARLLTFVSLPEMARRGPRRKSTGQQGAAHSA